MGEPTFPRSNSANLPTSQPSHVRANLPTFEFEKLGALSPANLPTFEFEKLGALRTDTWA